ncbi:MULTISPECIES: SDR family NAD(P)-dependent oxidoreductase [unclassified Rathayibacter]|uniref:SDR family NAD(P)-dependent oxidoreductase n=1 Tax=unclassified Rathayibacter TaxID=2609250 RepID=UPI0006FA199F|nr:MULTISPECIES: SDR family oxidoreductase [unclassified Rathayibacter]KQQ00040.1 oxidoreductase [Rathayibacter sp. Leaf294]KQS09494.1 oxidoreductase [Rathayibacter sp. Leaf185]
MDLHLAHRRAFVSGSTQGIGYAIARALLREGATVVINGRDDRRVQEAVRRLEGEVPGAEVPGAAVSGLAADLADASGTDRLLEELGRVDILINNAGLFEVTPFADVDDAEWAQFFDVNVMSAVRLSRALLPRMIDAGWGRIVFVGSESGVNVPADMVHYGVTKAAVLALGNGLAKLTRGTGVTVNTILGGPTYSDGVADAVRSLADANGLAEDEMKAMVAGPNRTSLLERFLEPGEIANLAVYLASPLSSATNGAALRADGGVLTAML